MTDIFREVDEEVRREQLKRLWERYQPLIVGAVLMVVLGVGGWRIYEWREARRAAEVGTFFDRAMTLAEDGQHEQAERAFAQVARVGPAGYRDMARLRAAAETASRDPAAATQAYQQIAADARVDPAFRELATLRLATLLIDGGSYEVARRFLEPLAAPGKDFRHTARELIVLASWKAGEMEVARKWYAVMTADADLPPSTRSRVEMLFELSSTGSQS